MERETGLEPATSTLARWHSTIESLTQLVQMKGVEPPRRKTLDPKSSASANSATSAYIIKLVAYPGIEPGTP